MQRKKIPGYANTRQHLNNSKYPPQAPSHSHLHITQIKEKERSRDVPGARRPQHDAPSSGLAPLEYVCLDNVHLSYTCTSRNSPSTPHTLVLCLSATLISCGLPRHSDSHVRFPHTPSVLSRALFSHSDPQHVCSGPRPALFFRSPPPELSLAHLRNVPRPLLGALDPHHHSHGHVTPPPCAYRSRDRQRRRIRICCFLAKQAMMRCAFTPLLRAGVLAGISPRRATPCLHPSRGECRHTVLV